MPSCNECGYTGPTESFPPAMSVYHDAKCPKCGTTNLSGDFLSDVAPGGRQ